MENAVTKTSALTHEQIRSLARKYPGLFAAVGGEMHMGRSDASAIGGIIEDNMGVLNDLVAAGTGQSADEVAAMSFLSKVLAAFEISWATQEALRRNPLTDLDEIKRIIVGHEVLQ